MGSATTESVALSSSVGSRSPRGTGKGAAPRKKVRKAKSELHRSKKHFRVAEEAGKEDVRNRVLDSLEHLGHQKLSMEAGGYDLRSWMKSLKTLLDDFEERIGADSISDEFRSRRKEVEERFSNLGDHSEVETEMEALRKEEMDINARLKEETERISSRLSAIGGEKTGKTKELEEERMKLHKIQEERRSVGFFSKLVGRSGPSTEPNERRVRELEAGLKALEQETLDLQAVRRSVEGTKDAAGGKFADLWKRLEDLEKRMEELSSLREEDLQLTKEREEAAEGLRRVISDLRLEGPKGEESAAA
jgi:DNA repair exonuclease SbcCD ATPase subunit